MSGNGSSEGAKNGPENGKEGIGVPGYRDRAPDPLQAEIDHVNERVTEVLEKRVIPLEHYQEENNHRLIGHDKQLMKKERGHTPHFVALGLVLLGSMVFQGVTYYETRQTLRVLEADLGFELRSVGDSIESIRNQTKGDQNYILATENQKLKAEIKELRSKVGHLEAESDIRAKTMKVLLEAAKEVDWDEKRQKWVCNP